MNIRLPGLRERLGDVPALAGCLLEGINRSMRCSYHLLPEAYESLQAYQYPGNVREVRNILFIAATHSHNREINAALIDRVINNLPQCKELEVSQVNEVNLAASEVSSAAPSAVGVEESSTLKTIEEKHIRGLLNRYKGNRKLVAVALGLSERTIYRKLKGLGIT